MHVFDCPRCGQKMADPRDPNLIVENRSPWPCDACRALDRAPQGETVRLFEPAPTQVPGQLAF